MRPVLGEAVPAGRSEDAVEAGKRLEILQRLEVLERPWRLGEAPKVWVEAGEAEGPEFCWPAVLLFWQCSAGTVC